MVFTAEKQSAVRTEAVIIQNMAVVAHSHIVSDKPLPTLTQRFGGNNKGADGNRLTLQRLEYRIQTGISIDGIYHIFTFDTAFRSVNQPTVLIRFDAYHGRMLKNLRTGFGSGSGNTQRVIERMKMPGQGIKLCALVHIAVELLLQFSVIPKLIMSCTVIFLGVLMPLLQFFPMLRTNGNRGITVLPITVNRIFAYALVHKLNRL